MILRPCWFNKVKREVISHHRKQRFYQLSVSSTPSLAVLIKLSTGRLCGVKLDARLLVEILVN